ncbi:MAG: hypothetical protein AB7I19_10700 [Planctomycetota bacterium]
MFSALLSSVAMALVATVNDPMSHGTLGDGLLSLDEAIQVANGTLAMNALSAAEQAQFSGTGMHVGEILLDPTTTPSIMVQAPITPLTAGGHMTGVVMIRSADPMAHVMLMGNTQPTVMSLRSHFAHIEGIHFMGGGVGLDIRMGMMGTTMPHMGMVHHCMFSMQSVAGVRAHGTADDETMAMLDHCHFDTMNVGIVIDDNTTSGMVMVEGEHVKFDGVRLGADVQANGSGLMSMLFLFRSDFVNGEMLARSRRAAGATGQFMFRFVHTDAVCTGDVVDIQGSPTALTMVHHHHGDFVASNGGKAFYCHPKSSDFDIHGSEMAFDGDVDIAGSRFTVRVWQQNNRYRNGTVRYDVDGALPNLLWNHYENCTIDVPAAARSPVTIRSSEFLSTSVSANSVFAPVQLVGCYRSGGTLGGAATESQPAPARFLGTTTVGPEDPLVGGTVQLNTDLPVGVGLVWDLALSISRPITTAEPVRLYADFSTAVVLHGLYALQSQLTITIPNLPVLVGTEFYFQGVSFPLFGQAFVPPFHLPRGTRVTPRI